MYWHLTSTILINPAFAQSHGYHDWHIGSWLMGECGMGWFGMIMMLVFWVLVIGAIIFLVQRLVQSSGDKTSRSTPDTLEL
jgi:putative membrane protein